MYKTLKEVTADAEKFNFTVGAFNMHNLEMLPAMIAAAKSKGSPIIIQTSVGTAKYIGYDVIVNVCKTLADHRGVDVCLHLDHCKDFNEIINAIDAGYSSVMYDGSALPLKENILRTREVVEYAHTRGVSVEGEVGTIGGSEEGVQLGKESAAFSDPKVAKFFADETGVDALAVSVGTCHGSYKAKTNLNFPLLKEIDDIVEIPLVIHGGTGVKDEDIVKCINGGVRKFNVGTELLVGWTRTAKEYFGQTKENESLRNNIVPCNDKVYEIVSNKIELFLNKNYMK